LLVVNLSIILPTIAIIVLIVGGYWWYRRAMRKMAPDETVRSVNGARLTSERLGRLPTPPWRFVFEVPGDRLGGIDHVVIGPSGVIAVTTLMLDRPPATDLPDAHQLAANAMLRAPVDDLVGRVGLACDTLAKVYFGKPQPDLPAAHEMPDGTRSVEGQRLTEWLLTLPPGPLTAAQIDLAWQAVLTGIGRPDPLA
jgi:hypothetical protein